MMISCKNVAKLLMADQLQSQGLWKRMEVRLHLAMCKICSRLARQIEQMRAGAQRMHHRDEADPGLEERLIKKLSGR